MTHYALFLVWLTVSVQASLIGRWKGEYKGEICTLEFTSKGDVAVAFQKKITLFRYRFLNDSTLKIGAETHRIRIEHDTLLRLRPLKIEKDISVVNTIDFYRE